MRNVLVCVALFMGCGGSGPAAPKVSSPAPASAPARDRATPTLDPSSQESLTAWARARLAALQPKPVVVKGPLTLGIEGTELVISLDRVWGVCSATPTTCEQSGEEFVHSVAQVISGKQTPVTADALRVVVRDADYLEQIAQGAAEKGPVTRRVAGDLSLLVVIDGESATRILRADELKGLGMTADAAVERALANTRADLGQLEPFTLQPGTIALVRSHTYYGTSVLAMFDLWAPAAKAVHGDLLVAVPGIEGLLIGDSAAPNALTRMSNAASQLYSQSQRAISTEVYRFTGTGWEVAAPAP